MNVVDLVPPALFYCFAGVLVLASLMVVVARNPVHSVLFLILAFFNAAGLFLMLGAEFPAFILMIVYVGAVAVLFLFVVMMLDIDFLELRRGAWKVWPVGLLVGAVLVAQLVMTAASWQSLPGAQANILSPAPRENALKAYVTTPEGERQAIQQPRNGPKPLTNTEALGRVLYTDYIYAFQVAGLVLLVAMIGAITLALRGRRGRKSQDIGRQISRKPSDCVAVRQVKTGTGVEC